MDLQQWIHHWEVGAGAKLVRMAVAILGFVVIATLFDALAYPRQGFLNEEAMETAQVARNLARGKGFTTQSVRPLSIYLLRREAPVGQAAAVVNQPMPDISTAPVYPILLAGMMKVLPFNFIADQFWVFPPERWIAVFNQVLYFLAAVLLFRIAFALFDSRVAWLSVTLFVGSNLYWKFSISGISTSWLLVVVLAIVLGLIRLQEREMAGHGGAGSVALAAWVGACVGVGGLSRYGVAWMIIPVVLFIYWNSPGSRTKLCVVASAAFVLVVAPWIGRNIAVTGTPFGIPSYALIEQTPPLPEDTLERSFDPQGLFQRIRPLDLADKLISNARDIWRDELPRLGGSWIAAFFLVGIFIPFRNPALGRMRIFLLGSLALMFIVQALGQTHLTADSPEINSENLLALLAPLTFVYGVALFYTLYDQLNLVAWDARGAIVGGVILVSSMPLLMSLLVGHRTSADTPYLPMLTQQVGRMMGTNEFMISDIPGAVAWYGDRPCGWLPLDDAEEFYQFNNLKPIKAVYLTPRTTDEPFLSRMALRPRSWGDFVFECESRGEVPAGFPLNKAVELKGFEPGRMLLSDKARWRMAPGQP